MNRKNMVLMSIGLVGLLLLSVASHAAAKDVINVYTSRHYGVESVFGEFTKDTGILVRFTTGGDAALRERIKAEGKNTLADVYIGSDAGNLSIAAKEGLLQPVKSSALAKNVPANLRDSENRWFALTKRARTIMYNPDKVKPSELSTYEELADPKWRGRLILRPASHPYTQALISNMIAAHGEARAEEIAKGWVANAAKFIDSDAKILEAVAAGEGDVAITNTYYLGRLLDANPKFPVRLFWANQAGKERGVHINISGGGVTAHSLNPGKAAKLLEWLSSPRGQKMFADSNHEFPANRSVSPHQIVAGFGSFKEDQVSLSDYGRLMPAAIKLMERVGYK
ncbi:MAG: extracellular solute-binding protein [Nitrospirota bacterium]|nr:extracellular solute-binding protein [Nitrospirota bacterium]